ncbi:Class I SAM-dependent methyltransferase [Candidatus Magnetomoraceae bacterium gMMP-13]
MKHRIKNYIKHILFSLYKFGTRLGVHILPVHYYSPVPDIVELEKTQSIWAKKSQLPGILVDLDEQVNNLKIICMPYQSEYEGNKAYRFAVDEAFGPGYGYIEAQALHAIIRYYKPKRIIEVGSGVSTWCILNALKFNKEEGNNDCLITCIEPYPSRKLKSLTEINLIEKAVQTVGYEDNFSDLGQNDFLFIDSSHTVKPGSDVNYLILEILPRLNAGVIVHFHDIYLPYDYEREVLQTFFHWMETSLLRAFLIHNDRTRIIFSQSHLHYDRRDAMSEVFPEYNPQSDINGIQNKKVNFLSFLMDEHFPSSIYIQMR